MWLGHDQALKGYVLINDPEVIFDMASQFIGRHPAVPHDLFLSLEVLHQGLTEVMQTISHALTVEGQVPIPAHEFILRQEQAMLTVNCGNPGDQIRRQLNSKRPADPY